MNIKNKIITKELLYAIMLLFMMVWANSALAQNVTSQEKLLYSTDFQDWVNVTSSDTETEINKNKNGQELRTTDGQPLSFYLKQTSVKNDGHKTDKKDWYNDTNRDFSVSDGWMMAEKKADPYARISEIKNVTKIVYIQTSTGSDRGWGLKAKSKDDTDWTIIYNTYIDEKPSTSINNVKVIQMVRE